METIEQQKVLNVLEATTNTKYEFIKLLDGGLSNEAFIAKDTEQGQLVVIKFLATYGKEPQHKVLAINDYNRESEITKALSTEFDFIQPIINIENTNCTIQPYVDGVTQTNNSIANTTTLLQVTELLNTLHNSTTYNEKILDFNLVEVFEDYLSKLGEIESIVGGCYYVEYLNRFNNRTKVYIDALNVLLQNKSICHNDALAGNFIKTKDGELNLIDFEYCAYNFPIWDVVSVMVDCELDEAQSNMLLDTYLLGTNIDEYNEMSRLDLNTIVKLIKYVQNDYWSLWGFIRCRNINDGYSSDVKLKSWAEAKRHNMIISQPYKLDTELTKLLINKIK